MVDIINLHRTYNRDKHREQFQIAVLNDIVVAASRTFRWCIGQAPALALKWAGENQIFVTYGTQFPRWPHLHTDRSARATEAKVRAKWFG